MKVQLHILNKKEKEEKPIILTGSFFQYDKPNKNGRVYTKEVCEQMVNQFGELEHPMYGELNPNYDMANAISFNNISHEILEIYLDEDQKALYGTIKVLDTPKGKVLQELLRHDIPLSVASRAFGIIDASGVISAEDYQLISYDIMLSENGAFKSDLIINNKKPLTMDDL